MWFLAFIFQSFCIWDLGRDSPYMPVYAPYMPRICPVYAIKHTPYMLRIWPIRPVYAPYMLRIWPIMFRICPVYAPYDPYMHVYAPYMLRISLMDSLFSLMLLSNLWDSTFKETRRGGVRSFCGLGRSCTKGQKSQDCSGFPEIPVYKVSMCLWKFFSYIPHAGL